MGLYDKVQSLNERAASDSQARVLADGSWTDATLVEWLGIDKKTDFLQEVTYYTCLKMLSETMGKLPLKYYQETADRGKVKAEPTHLTYLFTVRPNEIMTPTTMWATIEQNVQHFGNGYLWMRGSFTPSTYGGSYDVEDLWVLPSNCVTVIMDDKGVFADKGRLYYQYTDSRSGETYIFRSDEVLHFKTWHSFDGVLGTPVRDILKMTVEGASESQKVMTNTYKQGLTASMAMQYIGDLDDIKIKKLQQRFGDKLSGSQNAGKVVPVPIGLTLTPLKTSFTDAQFFELRKYSALQIAGAFGIKPNMINDYEKASYASAEMQQLAFLVDTMMYRIKSYEDEINGKALTPQEAREGKFYKFNEKALLRADSSTQMTVLKDGVNNAIYKPNEARDLLDLPWAEGGDDLYCNGNYIKLTAVGQQYGLTEGGE